MSINSRNNRNSLTRKAYKQHVEKILPTHEKRHERYFNAFVKNIGLSRYTYPKEEVISFLRSMIRINMFSCIDPNNKINRRNCNEDMKNVSILGKKIKINGKNIIDYFTKIKDNEYSLQNTKHGYYVIQNKNDSNQTVLQKYDDFLNFLREYNIPQDVYKYLILDIDLNQTYRPSFSRKSLKSSRSKSSRKSSKSLLMRISEGEDETNSIVSNNSEPIDFTKLNTLKTICSKSHVCIAFGREVDDITHFFNLKKNFKYATRVQTISNGVNGIVDVISYERESYQTNAILKRINVQSQDPLDSLDNLMYEYFVGHFFINEIKKKLPIFIETYGYIEDIELDYDIVTRPIGPNEYNQIKWKRLTKKSLEELRIKNISYREMNDALSFACNTPSKVGLLTEYLHNSKTLEWYLSPSSNRDYINFWIDELINILFQIYFCLVLIKDNFTHYDLHAQNVLIYKPINGKYIEYMYHYEGKVISFQSQYLVKIIDYGRSYFNSRDISSSKIYTMVCNNPQCNFDTKCGKSKGFTFLVHPTQPNSKYSYINSSIKNESHDLRLIYHISTILYSMYNSGKSIVNSLPEDNRRPFFKLFENVHFQKTHGTSEILQGKDRENIYNISDALKTIVDLMDNLPKINYHSLGYRKIGDLNVYDDGRDMEFIPT